MKSASIYKVSPILNIQFADIHLFFSTSLQVFSLIWNQVSWRENWKRVPGARSCWHRCLRFPLWSWSRFPLLRFHLPLSSLRRHQTPALRRVQRPPRLQSPQRPLRLCVWPASQVMLQTLLSHQGSLAWMTTKTPRRAKLTSTVLSVKSQSTPPPNSKHITAVWSTCDPDLYTFLHVLKSHLHFPLKFLEAKGFG